MIRGLRKTIHILLVEDNKADAELVRIVLKEADAGYELHVVTDGVEAMKYLRNQPPYEGAKGADFILLDLDLPRKNGREALVEIKADPQLRGIPIVIFTSSSAEEDILRSYRANANCYVTKPVDIHEFRRVVKAVVDFWSAIATLPAKGKPE